MADDSIRSSSRDGSALPQALKDELQREHQRLQLLEEQIRQLEAQRSARLRALTSRAEQQVMQLMRLGAIGAASAWLFVIELFGWRALRNRREVAGLVGTPYNSGAAEPDQGISQAGNRRVRAMAEQTRLAVAALSAAQCAVAAVPAALRRRGQAHAPGRHCGAGAVYLVALWRYLEHGVLPEGARLIASRG